MIAMICCVCWIQKVVCQILSVYSVVPELLLTDFFHIINLNFPDEPFNEGNSLKMKSWYELWFLKNIICIYWFNDAH
jgi:hypothetical protein